MHETRTALTYSGKQLDTPVVAPNLANNTSMPQMTHSNQLRAIQTATVDKLLQSIQIQRMEFHSIDIFETNFWNSTIQWKLSSFKPRPWL